MLSPLSAVQSNTRVTRSRSGATPAKNAPAPSASPARPSPSPVRKAAPTPEPATPAGHANTPGAPPPTPASPTFHEGAAAATQMAELLGHALAFVLPISEELQAASSPAKSDLGGELARAMEDLVVDPTTVSQSPALGVSPAGVRALVNSLPAWPTFDEHEQDDADEPVPLDDESEQTEDDDMMGVSRMKLNGMLPSGFLNDCAPRANTHIVFEQSEEASAIPLVDATRAHGLFPAGALSSKACSTSHVRFDEDEA